MATAKEFVEHWNWAAEKGVMNKNTALSLRAACTQVLSAIDNWESVDIASLDIEDTLTRFQNLKRKDFKPVVLDTYKRRFRSAVATYLKYLDDPAGWKPRTAERTSPVPKPNGKDRVIDATRATIHEMPQSFPQSSLVEYPFPLREGQITRLFLPRDLKTTEVKRLSAFMATLTVDFDQPPV